MDMVHRWAYQNLPTIWLKMSHRATEQLSSKKLCWVFLTGLLLKELARCHGRSFGRLPLDGEVGFQQPWHSSHRVCKIPQLWILLWGVWNNVDFQMFHLFISWELSIMLWWLNNGHRHSKRWRRWCFYHEFAINELEGSCFKHLQAAQDLGPLEF